MDALEQMDLDGGRDGASGMTQSRRTDQISDKIKRWILSRAMEPGSKLPGESELVEIFHCSRGTVRECLKSLEAIGLLKIVRGAGGGAQVSEIDQGRILEFLRIYSYFQHLSWRQIFELRQSIEPQVAANVFGRLTPEDFEKLDHTVNICSGQTCVEQNSLPHRIAELEFHRILAERCDNPLLKIMSLLVVDLISDLITHLDITMEEPDSFSEENCSAHRQILRQLHHGTPESVRLVMSAHVHAAGCFMRTATSPPTPQELLIAMESFTTSNQETGN